MLMMWSTDLHSRRKPKWYLRWSGTLVWIARADWMAVRDQAWTTKLHWTRATNWCWQSIYSLNRTLSINMVLAPSRALLCTLKHGIKILNWRNSWQEQMI